MMNRRTALLGLASGVAVGIAPLAGCGLGGRTKEPIEGVWSIVSAQLGGVEMPLAAFQDARLRLDGGLYEFGKDRGDFVVLHGPPPVGLNITGRDGPNVGKTILAIFELKTNELTVCYDLSGKTRPKAFKSEPGTQLFLVHYRREYG